MNILCRQLIPLLLLCVFPCLPTVRGSEGPEKPAKEEQKFDWNLYRDVRGEHRFEFQIHKDLPRCIFIVEGDKEDCIRKIRVYCGSETNLVQTLKVPEDGTSPPYRDADYFTMLDFNGDGYLDIKLLCSWGVTGNESFAVWLFEPTSKMFRYAPDFLGLENPKPVTRIRSHSNNGLAGSEYSDSEYVFENGKLVEVWRDTQELQGTYLVHVTMERRNGKLVEVRRSRKKVDLMPDER